MKFPAPLVKATLLRRYKRFLADVKMADGTIEVAHVANSGSMKGCAEEGSTVWLAPSPNPAAKLAWRWELIEVNGGLVGINTAHPNAIVAEAISNGRISELSGYETLKREVKYGINSRIDILLEGPGKCFVEVKNVTLANPPLARFPDAVTARGAKHLEELAAEVKAGHRAVMVYLVNREDCERFEPAADIDPAYARGLKVAVDAGVEVLVYAAKVTVDGIKVDRRLPASL